MNYIISYEAANDLDDIWLYTIDNWSEEQAERYFKLIFEEIEYLCKNPQSAIDYSHIRKGYLLSKVKSHLIFFKINKKEELEVIRILHQMMDIETHLNL